MMNFVMRCVRLAVLAVLPLVVSSAQAADKPGDKGGDEDYKAVTILARNCAGCHQEADHPGALFLNQARLSEPETIALITKLVETSQMPPAHVDFKKSKDGKALIKWLKKKHKALKK